VWRPMDTNELRAALGRARWGRKAWVPGAGACRDHTEMVDVTIDELEALEAVTVLSEGVTSAPAVPGLDDAFLELDGEEFVAVGEGESTMIFTGSGSVPI
jgi:hypothetical protein